MVFSKLCFWCFSFFKNVCQKSSPGLQQSNKGKKKNKNKKVKVAQLCPTLCDPMGCSPWNSPAQNTGVGSLSLLQGIFQSQRSNPGLPHCRQFLYQMSHKGSQVEWKFDSHLKFNPILVYYFPVSIASIFTSTSPAHTILDYL